MRLLVSLMIAALLGPLAAAPAPAAEQGTTSLGVGLASGTQLNKTYTVLTGRLGYYLVRDFEAAIGLEAWRGNDPSIYKLVPELRWEYSGNPNFGPYIGAFLSRTFYDGLPDRDTYGARIGVYFTLNRGSRLGAGAVTERISNCDTSTYSKCSQTYPEVALHFTF